MRGYAIIFVVSALNTEASPLFFFTNSLAALVNTLQWLLVRCLKVKHYSSDILSYIPQIEPVGIYPMCASGLTGE